jgi:hypothetical protein
MSEVDEFAPTDDSAAAEVRPRPRFAPRERPEVSSPIPVAASIPSLVSLVYGGPSGSLNFKGRHLASGASAEFSPQEAAELEAWAQAHGHRVGRV